MILSDKKLRELAKKGKIKNTEQTKTTKTAHPYIQHMAKLEQLIGNLGLSNESTKEILAHMASMLKESHGDNAKLLIEISALQKDISDLVTTLMDKDNDVWVSTVVQRDARMIIKEVRHEKVNES